LKNKGWALVTGATAGIGAATSEALARAGYSVVLLGRRQQRLVELEKTLSQWGMVRTLVADVQNRSELEQQLSSLGPILGELNVVVNNAGLALGIEKFSEGNISHWEQMIDTNIKGLLYITRILLPAMIERGQGHIVNIGSVAGRWVYPGGNVYNATKYAVRALSEGLRMDLLGTGLRVTNIEPGMVETEFSTVRLGDRVKADQVYAGMTPLSSQDIAEAVLWSLDRPAHVNIQEMVIFPTDQAAVTMVHRR
jgi:NADP-dependent 3-hydroxy acid dehydrogenase YdfG